MKIKAFLLCGTVITMLAIGAGCQANESPPDAEATGIAVTESANTEQPQKPSPTPVATAAALEKAEPIWEACYDLVANTAIDVTEDTVVIASNDSQISGMHDASTLLGVDLATGATRWQLDFGYNGYSYASDTGIAYIAWAHSDASGIGELLALRIADGETVWRHTGGRECGASITLAGAYICALSESEAAQYTLRFYKQSDGMLAGEMQMDGYCEMYGYGGALVLYNAQTQYLFAADPATQRILWSQDNVTALGKPQPLDATQPFALWCLCGTQLVRLSAATGEAERQYTLDEPFMESVGSADGEAYRSLTVTATHAFFDTHENELLAWPDAIYALAQGRTVWLGQAESALFGRAEFITVDRQDGVYSLSGISGENGICIWRTDISGAESLSAIRLYWLEDVIWVWTEARVMLFTQSGAHIETQLFTTDEGKHVSFPLNAWVFEPRVYAQRYFLPFPYGLRCYLR